MTSLYKGRSWLGLIVIFSAVGLLYANVGAQTHRRTTKAVAKATPTPTPAAGDAQIIGTAADQNQPAAYVGPPAVTNADPQTDPTSQKVKDLTARVKKLESAKADPYDERQRRLLLNLDILTRAEQRSESLRKQLFDMIEKEDSVKTRLDQIESDSRPEVINRSAAFSGSMHPEEIREMRKKSLDSEKQNLQALLSEIQSTRASLSLNLVKSDALVEKLRSKLEKDIDDSFKDEDKDK
jgi:hypothetical protein